MNSPLGVQKFLVSTEAELIRAELQAMMDSTNFKTETSYSPSSDVNLTFVEKHIKYLSQHQNVNSQHYLSNLRLMTKIS